MLAREAGRAKTTVKNGMDLFGLLVDSTLDFSLEVCVDFSMDFSVDCSEDFGTFHTCL